MIYNQNNINYQFIIKVIISNFGIHYFHFNYNPSLLARRILTVLSLHIFLSLYFYSYSNPGFCFGTRSHLLRYVSWRGLFESIRETEPEDKPLLVCLEVENLLPGKLVTALVLYQFMRDQLPQQQSLS